jgi:hypothetical protein
MKSQLLIVALALSIPTVVAAQSNHGYPCTNGGLTRRVEVVYAGATDVPCEVRYFKEGEATPQVLWSATTQAGYCEAQAREFVARLQGMGWVCSDSGTSQAAGPAPGAAPRAGDDTAVLGAGGERN